jgi:hypothetical protein
MRRSHWSRLRSVALVAAGGACLAAAVVGGACVVAPPAELPPATLHRPTILHGSVVPPAYLPLTAWTAITPEFNVPVELDDVNESFVWDVFVDYSGNQTLPAIFPTTVQPGPGTIDGGVTTVTFRLDPQSFDLGFCHTIEMLVGHQLLAVAGAYPYRAFDSVGYDSVSWTWTPPGSPGCDAYAIDAGTQPVDASSDVLPVPPVEAGGATP